MIAELIIDVSIAASKDRVILGSSHH